MASMSLLLVVAVLALTADASKLPPGIIPCSRNDPELLNECALRNAQAAIPFMAKGHPAFGLLPMDPLYVSEMRVDDSGTSHQITVNVVIRPFVITGLRDVKVKNFKIDLKTGEVTWSGFAPRLEMIGKYAGSGRILFMPVRGSGNLNVTLIDTEFTHSFRLIRAENRRSTKLRSVEFVTPRDSVIENAPGNALIHLENLFNGDKRLEDHMNQFLTENWRELNNEIGPSISEMFNAALMQLFTRIFELVPFEQLFPFENNDTKE